MGAWVIDVDEERPEAPLVRLPTAEGGTEEVRLHFPEFALPEEAPPSPRGALAS